MDLPKQGTIFCDIDGTLVEVGTEEPLPGAIESINRAYDKGFHVVLTTMRCDNWGWGHKWSQKSTERMLEVIGVKYHRIIWGVPSPRILINDEGASAIPLKRDTGFTLEF